MTSGWPGPQATAARQVMAAGGDEDAAAAAIRFSEVGAGAAALLCEVGVTCED